MAPPSQPAAREREVRGQRSEVKFDQWRDIKGCLMEKRFKERETYNQLTPAMIGSSSPRLNELEVACSHMGVT